MNIHVEEILRYVDSKRQKAESNLEGGGGNEYFLGIDFNDPKGRKSGVIDEDYKDKVITVDCPYGTVTILFDDEGQLRSIEIC